jgi:hypothetical protein
MSRLLLCLRVGAVCISLASFAIAQSEKPQSADRVRTLTQAAGIIFRGTVTSVERIGPTRQNQLETMQICFRIAENLRGTKTGSILCIREWAGLWTSRDRYRPGEHVALFLYPPSRLGLTSPVGGNEGRFDIQDSHPLSASSPTNQLVADTAQHANLRLPARHVITANDFRQLVRRSVQQRGED